MHDTHTRKQRGAETHRRSRVGGARVCSTSTKTSQSTGSVGIGSGAGGGAAARPYGRPAPMLNGIDTPPSAEAKLDGPGAKPIGAP